METSDSAPDALPPELGPQRELLDAWLQSDDAVDTARRLLSRRGVSGDPAELVNAAWVRIHESIARRTEPFPDITLPEHAARYGARVLDNLSRDRLRTVNRRKEVELLDSFVDERANADLSDSRLMLRHLHAAVAARAQQLEPCPGCPDEVVAAAALELIHLVLAGNDGGEKGRTWFDQMLYLALDRVDGGVTRSDAAANQRKARCGRCIDGLLRSGGEDLMGSTS